MIEILNIVNYFLLKKVPVILKTRFSTVSPSSAKTAKIIHIRNMYVTEGKPLRLNLDDKTRQNSPSYNSVTKFFSATFLLRTTSEQIFSNVQVTTKFTPKPPTLLQTISCSLRVQALQLYKKNYLYGFLCWHFHSPFFGIVPTSKMNTN